MRLYGGRRQRKAKKKRHFADYIVFLSIIAVTGFTVAAFVLQFKGLMEISATLTTCWFAFWTVEIIALASIRNQKTKHNYKNKEGENDEN
jgi:glycopeptide antibiotics resistance protein